MSDYKLKVFKPLKVIKAESKYALRSKKMIRPICEECATQGLGWWVNCLHDPYHRLKAVTVRSEGRVVDPETGLVTKTEPTVKIQSYAHVPNLTQVFLTMRINSGLGVEAALAKGYLFPEEVKPTLPTGEPDPEFDGYAPMCEFQNCYSVNPKVKARHNALAEQRMVAAAYHTGYYCSERHAKLAKQRDLENQTREVHDPAKRREQLDAIPLP